MKKEISKSEYWEIVGLLSLAKGHQKIIRDIAESLRELTGEEDLAGYCSDAAWAEPEPNDLLKRLGIVVKE